MFPAKRVCYYNIQDFKKSPKFAPKMWLIGSLCAFPIVYFLISPVSDMKMWYQNWCAHCSSVKKGYPSQTFPGYIYAS